jgi:hypothetical protein
MHRHHDLIHLFNFYEQDFCGNKLLQLSVVDSSSLNLLHNYSGSLLAACIDDLHASYSSQPAAADFIA